MNTCEIWAQMAHYFRNERHKRTMALCPLYHDIVMHNIICYVYIISNITPSAIKSPIHVFTLKTPSLAYVG